MNQLEVVNQLKSLKLVSSCKLISPETNKDLRIYLHAFGGTNNVIKGIKMALA